MPLCIALQKQSMGDSRAEAPDDGDWFEVVAEVCSQVDEHGAFIISKDLGDRLREMANRADCSDLKTLQNVQKAYNRRM